MNTNAWQTNTPANNAYGGFNLDFLQSGYGDQYLVNNPTGNPNGVGNLNLPASGGTGGGANTGGIFRPWEMLTPIQTMMVGCLSSVKTVGAI